jgi:hypothetical protein
MTSVSDVVPPAAPTTSTHVTPSAECWATSVLPLRVSLTQRVAAIPA